MTQIRLFSTNSLEVSGYLVLDKAGYAINAVHIFHFYRYLHIINQMCY